MGTGTIDRTAELERLLGADRLARPLRPLGEGTAGKRDPSPTWDAWYSWPLPIRRQLLPYMAPAGDRGALAPDQLASIAGLGSIDEALEAWRRVCLLARKGETGWAGPDVDDWAAADAQADSDAELYGPAEYAAHLGLTVAAVHQRRHRGQLPAPDLILSRVPIWTGETIRIWEEWEEL